MKTGLIFFACLLLTACSSNIGSDISTGFNALTPVDRPDKNELNELVEKIVDEMLANNAFVGRQNPIAVASIVNLEDLNTTSRLGYQISEGIVHYLHEKGFRVVDFKVTGNIQVTGTGDFAQSRDWQKLNKQLAIEYIVTGNMDRFGDGLNVSVRMVGAQTNIVVGSSQAFITGPIVKNLMPVEPEMEPENIEMAQADTIIPPPPPIVKPEDTQAMIDSAIAKALEKEKNNTHQVQSVNGRLYRRSSL